MYGESCEGADLADQTCEGLGYHGGTLTCTLECQYDLESCEASGRCGDGEIQFLHGEQCDGEALDETSCQDLGYYTGTLTCDEACRFDESACSESCGDGLLQESFEDCDDTQLNGQSCRARNFFTGALGCTPGCEFDETECTDVVHLSAGYIHSCVALDRGTARCWGNGSSGRLGDGDTSIRLSPVQVTGLGNVISVAAGTEHSCAVLSDGTAKCWGKNDLGHCGDGSTNSPRLVPVEVLGLSGATTITVGWRHSCALLGTGEVRCWGANDLGQLGNNVNGGFAVTSEAVFDLNGVTTISAGEYYTCARLSTGAVKCWGSNDGGQLGDGTTTNRIRPVDVLNVSSALGVDAGYQHTCAVLSSGTVRCWGTNLSGQLGDATTTSRFSGVQVSSITNATAVEAGHEHTCALLADGTIRCWGKNDYGQLGVGNYLPSSVPIAVPGLTGVVQVTLGASFTCARLIGGKTLKCWGSNQYGSIGDGTTMDRPGPVTVAP